jgi:hypothetical protein
MSLEIGKRHNSRIFAAFGLVQNSVQEEHTVVSGQINTYWDYLQANHMLNFF